MTKECYKNTNTGILLFEGIRSQRVKTSVNYFRTTNTLIHSFASSLFAICHILPANSVVYWAERTQCCFVVCYAWNHVHNDYFERAMTQATIESKQKQIEMIKTLNRQQLYINNYCSNNSFCWIQIALTLFWCSIEIIKVCLNGFGVTLKVPSIR